MTLREYYVERREAELPAFMEVFKALPEGELDYKPAEKSPTANEIAWTMTRQLKSCIEIINVRKNGMGGFAASGLQRDARTIRELVRGVDGPRG